MSRIHVVVLAAGRGGRLKVQRPKVLVPIHGQSLISYVLKAIRDSAVSSRPPVLVVGFGADEVRQTLGTEYQYVVQEQQRGTGDAVAASRSLLEPIGGSVVVLNGDMPLISFDTIRRLVDVHVTATATVTMASVTVPNFEGCYARLYDHGRVCRTSTGSVTGIIECPHTSAAQRRLTELNPSIFCFSAPWLWENLSLLPPRNTWREYYLSDLVGIACSQGHEVHVVSAPASEAFGVNVPEDLEQVQQFLANSR